MLQKFYSRNVERTGKCHRCRNGTIIAKVKILRSIPANWGSWPARWLAIRYYSVPMQACRTGPTPI